MKPRLCRATHKKKDYGTQEKKDHKDNQEDIKT